MPTNDQKNVLPTRPVQTFVAESTTGRPNVRPTRPRRPERALVFSRADGELWDFLDVVGVATINQISRYLGRSESTLRRRLPKHRRLGITNSRSVGNGSHTQVWWLTKQGSIAGIGRRHMTGMSTPALPSLAHALALTEVFIHLSAEVGSGRLVHERAIIASDLHGNTKVATDYAGRRGRVLLKRPRFVFPTESLEGTGDYQIGAIHLPDLLLRTDPSPDGWSRFEMHECEVTSKSNKRVTDLLRAAASERFAPHISGITYWVCSDAVEHQIVRSAKTAHVEVTVRRFAHPVPDLLWRP